MNKKMRTKRQRPHRTPFSALLGLPARFVSWLSASALGRFFLSYTKSREAMASCRLATRLRESRVPAFFRPVRRHIGEFFANSRLLLPLRQLGDILRYTETRVYGVLFGTFGLYTILSFAIRHFALWARVAERSVLVTGIMVTVISLPLLFVSRPLCVAVQEDKLLNAFFYRLAGLPQHRYVKKKRLTINATAAFGLGSLLGIASFFFHPLQLLSLLFGTGAFLLLFFSPELCLYTTLLLCPLFFFFEHPSLLLTAVLLTGALGYLLKVILGKRTFSFEPLDLAVLLLLGLYVSATVFSRGGTASVAQALLYAALLLGYFLAANLLTTPATVNRALTALVGGGMITAIFGLLQQLSGRAIANWLDASAYEYISGRITAAFGNPNVLATYLILLFPFVTIGLSKKGGAIQHIGAFLTFVAFMAAIVLTWSRGAWLGALLSLAILLFAYNPATIYLMIPAAAGSLLVLQRVDASFVRRLFSMGELLADSSISYRLSTWQGALTMAHDHMLGGIGVGPGAFQTVYPYYALSGIEAAPHAHNLALQYLCEFGLAGPLLLLFFILLFFQCLLSHQREESNSALRLQSMAVGSGILAVLVYGLTDHVFYNPRIFFLFFAVAGIGAALSRVGRLEKLRNAPIRDTEALAYTVELEITDN